MTAMRRRRLPGRVGVVAPRLGRWRFGVPVEEIDRFDEALVRDEIAAEAEVVDEGAVLVDGWVEEQPRVLMVEDEEPVGFSAPRRDGRAPDRPAGLR